MSSLRRRSVGEPHSERHQNPVCGNADPLAGSEQSLALSERPLAEHYGEGTLTLDVHVRIRPGLDDLVSGDWLAVFQVPAQLLPRLDNLKVMAVRDETTEACGDSDNVDEFVFVLDVHALKQPQGMALCAIWDASEWVVGLVHLDDGPAGEIKADDLLSSITGESLWLPIDRKLGLACRRILDQTSELVGEVIEARSEVVDVIAEDRADVVDLVSGDDRPYLGGEAPARPSIP